MMKSLNISIMILIIAVSLSSADTIIPGGDISGTWNLAGSPYIIMGNITIQSGYTLVVDPGVDIRFELDVNLTVLGSLWADGTVAPGMGDIITFTSNLTNPQMYDWGGIQVIDNGQAELVFCEVTYGIISGEGDSSAEIDIVNSEVCDITDSGWDLTIDNSVVNGDISSTGEIYHCITLSLSVVHGTINAGTAECHFSLSTINGDISLGYTRDTYIQNCSIYGLISGGISYIGGSYSISQNTLFCGGINITHSSEVHGEITENALYDSPVNAISVNHTGHPSLGGDVNINNNIIDGGTVGISVSSSGCDTRFSLAISGNTITDMSNVAIFASGRMGGGIFDPFSAQINENLIDNCCNTGIHIEYFDEVEMTHNIIINASADAILVDNAVSWYRDVSIAVLYNVISHLQDNGIAVTNPDAGTEDIIIDVVNNSVLDAGSNGIIIDNLVAGSGVFTILNNIVSGSGQYGVSIPTTGSANVSYNDVWNSVLGDYSGVTPGSGSISLDPQFVDPDNYDLSLQRISPCIDAGDPTSPPDPDGTQADMGALYHHQDMPVKLTLNPEDPPIVIPETGGEFGFNIEVTNRTEEVQAFDFWSEIELPGWGSVEIMSVTGLSIAVGDTVDRDRTQTVPDFAPAGIYTYLGYVGTYPWIVEDYYYFYVEKEGSDQGGMLGTPSDWICNGESFDILLTSLDEGAPIEFALFEAFPNPFNATTILSYVIPEARHVSLQVYDCRGCMMCEIVNGWRNAGRHEVVFDASEMPSGIYFMRLDYGDRTELLKLVLIK